MTKLVITLEAGIISSIMSNQDIEYVVIDRDIPDDIEEQLENVYFADEVTENLAEIFQDEKPIEDFLIKAGFNKI